MRHGLNIPISETLQETDGLALSGLCRYYSALWRAQSEPAQMQHRLGTPY